jgi:AraC-like DNA-binding protein
MKDLRGGDLRSSVTLDFLNVGTKVNRVDGYVYGKTVPCGILTQALTGSYEVAYAGRSEPGPTGTMMFAPPHVPLVFTHHADPGTGTMTIRFAHFRFIARSGVDVLDLLRIPRALPPRASAELGEIFDELLEIVERQDSGLGGAARGQELGFALLRILTENAEMRSGAADALDDEGPIGSLLQEIAARPGDDWTVERLARAGQMSRSSLYRHFVSAVGVPPMEHLKRARLDEGARRLLHGTAKIGRIAHEIGFATADHFGREFARRFGVTPSAYRADPFFGRAAPLDRGRATT